ncbi:hypothetical protein [Sulfitobacter sp. 1A13679]|uniref:hypothetical protein n=1 Tax=Sulfitobacter sp. 1A13679 TaxID=3368597 RepID=UPI003747430A
MTKISDDDTTIFHAADAGGLVQATQDTISALQRHGYIEHAAVIRRATAQFVAGRSLVEIGTLRRWWSLFEHAWDLLANSPIDDPCVADDTADIAAGYIYRELVALGVTPSKGDMNTKSAWAITYDDLNADLNNAYEILTTLPRLTDPALEARVNQVAELLDQLTYDTCADTQEEFEGETLAAAVLAA